MTEKRKCKFNDELRKEYPFIKQMKPGNFSDVHCVHCESTFSIAHGGRSDIKDHIKTKKHLRAEGAASCSEKLSSYFSPKFSGKEQLILAAKEGVHAFHTVMHNHSFRSSDCTAQLTRKLYETKFSCGRTKTEAIISKILAPAALEDLKSEMEKCHFVSLSTDTSNHKDKKIVPVMVRYILPQDGVKVKLLELKELPGETADILPKNVFDVIEKYNLNKKIVAFGADNTNTMMGGSKQNGENNVLIKLKMKYGSHIIGIGCTAHIIHNAAQIAVDQLPIDIESIIVKIYKYFWIYTVRVERLKYFCDFVQSDYKKLLGYSSTRWLALLPSVRRILEIFEALKAFFLSESNCPIAIKRFFENPMSELWLKFVETQMKIFHDAITSIENENCSAVETFMQINELRQILADRDEEKFVPSNIIRSVFDLEEDGECDSSNFYKTVHKFYQSALNYFNMWTEKLEFCTTLRWISLEKTPAWEEVLNTVTVIKKSFSTVHFLDETELFDELSKMKTLLSSKIDEWELQEKKTSISDKWTEIFDQLDKKLIDCTKMKLIIEYALSLPATNSDVERVFSVMNNIWTEDKNSLNIEILKSILLLRVNSQYSCSEYYDYLLKNSTLCKKIHSSEKYQ